MKIFRGLSKSYSLLGGAQSFNLKDRPYLLPVFGFALGVLLVGVVILYGNRFHPLTSDSHVVFIFDNGHQSVVDTKAATVGQLTGRLPLDLTKQDIVEPSAQTQIVQDNFRVNIYRARPVTVVVGGRRTVVLTGQRSARLIAQEAGLTVAPEDGVTFEPGNIADGVFGEEVAVVRSHPVYLNLYGTSLKVRTLATTVAGLLEEKQIRLNKGDQVKPALSTRLTTNTQVFILRQGSRLVTVAQSIAPPIQIIKDPSLTFGVSVVRQPGQAGKRLITFEIDKAGHRKQIQSAIVQEAVPEIIAKGTNVDIPTNKTTIMADAGLSPSDYQYADFIVSHESNWNPTAANYSGAYGLCQALPGSKMASAGADWQEDPVTQMRWCNGYATGHYGSWAGAYSFWQSHGWW